MVTPDTRSEASTPDDASIAGDDIVAEPVVENSEENRRSIASSSIKGKQKEHAPPTPVGEDVSEDPEKSRNLVGKMNNLVSTDLENLVDGRDFLLLGLLLATSLSIFLIGCVTQFCIFRFRLSYALGSYTAFLVGVHLWGRR